MLMTGASLFCLLFILMLKLLQVHHRLFYFISPPVRAIAMCRLADAFCGFLYLLCRLLWSHDRSVLARHFLCMLNFVAHLVLDYSFLVPRFCSFLIFMVLLLK